MNKVIVAVASFSIVISIDYKMPALGMPFGLPIMVGWAQHEVGIRLRPENYRPPTKSQAETSALHPAVPSFATTPANDIPVSKSFSFGTSSFGDHGALSWAPHGPEDLEVHTVCSFMILTSFNQITNIKLSAGLLLIKPSQVFGPGFLDSYHPLSIQAPLISLDASQSLRLPRIDSLTLLPSLDGSLRRANPQ